MIIDVTYIFGLLHHMDVGDAASVFRVEVCKVG
jgi:hypothetical protein